MSYYESVFLARPDITVEQAEGLADTFTQAVEKQGGKVVNRENWGIRNLNFRIKKNRKAHYIMLNVDAPGTAIHELERLMRLNEDVIRFMTIKVDALSEEPSVLMQQKPGRDERPRREPRDRDREPRDRDREPRDRDRNAAAETLVKAETDYKEAQGDEA
jgi:small subunit ribosomal protein S6